MRFLKIILILISFAGIGLSLYTMYQFSVVMQGVKVSNTFYIVFGLLIIFSFFNVMYHFKSFRFYRPKLQQQLHTNSYKLVWIGGYSLPVFLFSLLGFLVYMNMWRFTEGHIQSDELIVLAVFLAVGIVEFLETLALQKRVKKLKENYDNKIEIDDIGK